MSKFSHKAVCEALGDGNNPYSIGGRDTDIANMAGTFKNRAKEIFPINQVPQELVDSIQVLEELLKTSENRIEDVIELMTKLYDDTKQSSSHTGG